MKKTILIPTDFTIESLNVVKSFLSKSNKESTYDIILLHSVHLNDSITDLLFFSRIDTINSLTNRQFNDACDIIKNKYASQINSIRKDIFTGINQASFNNYIEANRVDEAFIPANYKLNLSSKKSFDILPFIKQSDLHVDEIDWKVDSKMPEKGKLAEIFFTGNNNH